MAQINSIRAMIRKDLSQFLHNKSFVITAILTILFNLMLPNVLTFQVRNVSVATVVYDQSELTTHLLQNIVYASDIDLTAQCATYDEALSLVKEGTADCIIEIPPHFERDFLHQALGMNAAKPRIQITANAINTTKVLAATQSIAGSIASSMTSYAKDRGVAISQKDSFITTKNLYNPSFDYKLLMLPVIFIVVAFVFNTATRVVTNELQYGTIDQINVSPMSRLSYMTSKLMTCYIVSMIYILASMVSQWLAYSFVPHGNMLLILLALSFYVIACSSISLTFCNLLSNTSQMILITSLFGLICMMMSGFITPLECVADWLIPLSYALPTRYVIIILRNVALKGSDIADLATNFIPLALLAVLYFSTSVLSFKKSRE